MIRRLAIVGLLLVLGCTGAPPRFTGSTGSHGPNIRVLLAERSGAVTIGAPAGTRVVSGGLTLLESTQGTSLTVTRAGTTVQVSDAESSVAAEDMITIVPTGGGVLTYERVQYAGSIAARAGNGKTQLINILPLETYLEGVVPHEIGKPGPEAFAAVEAQAITARTYALARVETRQTESFDVHAGVQDQVYRGRSGADALATSAIRETRGQVLQYKGKLATTYYSATCGGHTSDIRRVWPHREPAGYLYGNYDRPAAGGASHCLWVRNFRWRVTYTGRELGTLLRRTIPKELGAAPESVGAFVGLEIVERSPSGRVRVLDIQTTTGSFTVEGDRIRWVLMADVDSGRILPSTLFEVQSRTSGGRVALVSIVGGGNGHGVGMCQNGAIGMARKGNSHRMILAHYYPGTKMSVGY